ncbi:alpha/beta fold hydrolase [Streptomyces sp. KLOTTS4A1]|uniref:alpha/beta fold hydrolase n=1 Tax=Streptomyces sp. KLOTTS4A1 TaxID=3390996 RepID=UPI0039F63F48
MTGTSHQANANGTQGSTAPAATQYLDTPSGRIAYDVTGEGPLVVMAPGMGDVRAVYRHLVPHLVAAGHRVATMDLRGHGESGTDWSSYTTSAVGADYVALIRHLGGGPATVVGQSFSPDSAVTAAAELPDDITGVVALSPWAAEPQQGAFTKWLTGRALRSPFLWGLFYASLHKGPKPADFKAHLRTVKSRLREAGRTEAFIAVNAPGAKDSAADRPRVQQPALILMGAKDPDFKSPRAEAETFASTLGGPCEIVLLEGAGHYPQAEFPAETAAALLPFLKRTTRA